MDELKKLVESLGVENADGVVKSLQEQIDSKISEVKQEYDAKLAKTTASIQEAAREEASVELEQEKHLMHEWHKTVIGQELAQVDNQLKIAKEVRNVRSGMEKVMEGLKEVGVDTTQMFENVAASEVIALQDRVDELAGMLKEQANYTKAFCRAFIVSEATRGLSDVGRDEIISQADAIDESFDNNRFAGLVKLMIADKNLKESSQKKNDNSITESSKSKSSASINEGFTGYYDNSTDDVVSFFRK